MCNHGDAAPAQKKCAPHCRGLTRHTAHTDGLGPWRTAERPAALTQERSLVVARKLTTAREILLWMTP